jgi:hypothetical protein
MASIRITIDTNSAAFHGEPDRPAFLRAEVVRILGSLSVRLIRGATEEIAEPLRDHNGNIVGKFEMLEDLTEREQTEERASQMNLRIALRNLVEAADQLESETFEYNEDFQAVWLQAVNVLKQEQTPIFVTLKGGGR